MGNQFATAIVIVFAVCLVLVGAADSFGHANFGPINSEVSMMIDGIHEGAVTVIRMIKQ
jgi:hypothetical protein